MRSVYGPPRVMSRSDWGLFTNEQFGFTAALDAAQTLFAFAMPYPSGFNLETQTITTSKFEYDLHAALRSNRNSQELQAYMSMLDKEFTATYISLGDADDENMRAHFAGPIAFGDMELITAIADANGNLIDFAKPGLVGADWYPEIRRVDQLTPLYIQLVNASRAAPTVVGGSVGQQDFVTGSVEQTTLREWFNVRSLTSAEKSMRNQQLQWLRLNT